MKDIDKQSLLLTNYNIAKDCLVSFPLDSQFDR